MKVESTVGGAATATVQLQRSAGWEGRAGGSMLDRAQHSDLLGS